MAKNSLVNEQHGEEIPAKLVELSNKNVGAWAKEDPRIIYRLVRALADHYHSGTGTRRDLDELSEALRKHLS